MGWVKRQAKSVVSSTGIRKNRNQYTIQTSAYFNTNNYQICSILHKLSVSFSLSVFPLVPSPPLSGSPFASPSLQLPLSVSPLYLPLYVSSLSVSPSLRLTRPPSHLTRPVSPSISLYHPPSASPLYVFHLSISPALCFARSPSHSLSPFPFPPLCR